MIIVHCISPLYAPMLEFCVEKPPVAIVVNEWHNASNHDIPSIFSINAEETPVVTQEETEINIFTGIFDFSDLKPAKVLNDGDHIQTGEDGFGALVYLDDKSTIKVKENTNFDVIGTRGEKGISKRI